MHSSAFHEPCSNNEIGIEREIFLGRRVVGNVVIEPIQSVEFLRVIGSQYGRTIDYGADRCRAEAGARSAAEQDQAGNNGEATADQPDKHRRGFVA